MASRLIYLEVDDEISSAASRIRSAEQDRLALVLPHGSRVATSRINFRLLSRDAIEHDKRLSIVSADAATRALAASAGLPVFASVAEYEGAEAGAAATGSAAAGLAGTAVIPPSAREQPSAATADGNVAAAVGVAALAGADPTSTIRAPVAREITREPTPRPDTSARGGGSPPVPVTTGTASREGGGSRI